MAKVVFLNQGEIKIAEAGLETCTAECQRPWFGPFAGKLMDLEKRAVRSVCRSSPRAPSARGKIRHGE